MKEFFEKYGGGSREPHQALEMIIEKLFRAKDKIDRGDSNIMNELVDASEMLDEFAHHAKTTEFKPREYQNIQGGNQGSYPQNRMGYVQDHYYPIYPIYPYFDERGGQSGNRRDRNDYDDYRRNMERRGGNR